MTNLEKLASCFREALALDSNESVETLGYQQHKSWDSVGHMRLVAALETSFDIMMDTDQILGMSCYSKAKETLVAHGVSFDA